MGRVRFDHTQSYNLGRKLLDAIHWKPAANEMLKLPSTAKGTELRKLCDQEAVNRSLAVEEIIDCAHHAARLDHLIAIGGVESEAMLLLSKHCALNSDQIARLCRRMPPFIERKLIELRSGPVNIDSNPSGAFDTNGWGELRTRLPKFRSTMQHYARQCNGGSTALICSSDAAVRLLKTCAEIGSECDELLEWMSGQSPKGEGVPRSGKPRGERTLDWKNALTKLSQVRGVLEKTNRDVRSEHWKPAWIPTRSDLEIVSSDVQTMTDCTAVVAKCLTVALR